MRLRTRTSAILTASALLLAGCETERMLDPSAGPSTARASTGFATLTKLPALRGGSHGEAYAVDRTGSVIVGFNWDRDGRMIPVTWTLQSGSWTIKALPYPATATSATARAINDQLEVAGNDFPASSPHPLLWSSTGQFEVLGCGDLGNVYGISAGGRTVVGSAAEVFSKPTAAVWQPGLCREDLPSLVPGGSARAHTVSGDGSIVGGGAHDANAMGFVPVRWRRGGGLAEIEKLDSRQGRVFGGNSAGDLVGKVDVPCASASTCRRGTIWYAAGGSLELGTLGGESTHPRAINAAGEVVGSSDVAGGGLVPFIWSAAVGMRQLPISNGGWAFGVSGVRANGTRLVVGVGGRPSSAVVWEVR